MVRVANEYLDARCRVDQNNPKKQASAERYEKYKHARTLGEVLKLGGSRGDIGNDMIRGYIVCEDKEINMAILMTANESERRHLPANIRDRFPPSSGSDPRTKKSPGQNRTPAKYAPMPERKLAPPPKKLAPAPPPRKLAPAPDARWANATDDSLKRRRNDDSSGPVLDKATLRKRAIACNKKRAKIFGRTVGKGRLLPVYDDQA